MSEAYKSLESYQDKTALLAHMDAFLSWDESAMMPSGGGNARLEALSYLQVLLHERTKSKNLHELVEKASRDQKSLDAWQKRNIEMIARSHKHATILPSQLVEDLSRASRSCEQAWRTQRHENNWKAHLPLLEKVFELTKQKAEIFAEASGLPIYDAMLDLYEEGLRFSHFENIFKELQEKLPTLVKKISEKQKSASKMDRTCSTENQATLLRTLMEKLGFDFAHGRLDTSVHPFCGGEPSDVRLTTRYNEEDFSRALMGALHETGHALYEQGLPRNWIRQPVGRALGMIVHESQSLFWEMQVCRSKEFLSFLLPHLKIALGRNVELKDLTEIFQKVEPTLIRIDSDEVTYPLHILIRTEIEKACLEGKMKVKEIPELWNVRIQEYLGLNTEGDYKNGCMQDVHWPAGLIGYFPCYSLGRLLAAMFFEKMTAENPHALREVAGGDFSKILNWLRKNVHSKASLTTMPELNRTLGIQRLDTSAFFRHIESRYNLA